MGTSRSKLVTGITAPASVFGKDAGYAGFDGGVMVNGKVYGIPCCAEQIMVFDTATLEVTGISAASARSGHMWSGGVAAEGKLYCIPNQAEYILVLDLTTNDVSQIPIPDTVRECGGGPNPDTSKWSKWAGGVYANGKVYGASACVCVCVCAWRSLHYHNLCFEHPSRTCTRHVK